MRDWASRYLGIGARALSRRPSPHEPPPRLPLGHPHLGVRNQWYMLCAAEDLRDEPRAMRVLGEDLVLWRDGNRTPRLMADHCPHRGARLSLGDVVNGELQCWYHFWRYDGQGQCTSVPSQGGRCKLQERTAVATTYPAVQAAGFIWAWIGDDQPAVLELPFEFEEPSYSVFPETVTWSVNWRLILENLADVMHAPFLHSKSLTLSRGLSEDRVGVSETDDGFRVERKGQRGVNFDWIEMGTGSLLWARLDIPYPNVWVAGPGPPLRILSFVTPIDESRTLVHFPRFRQVEGWRRVLWRTLYHLRLRGTHMHVLNQDKAILESLGTLERATRDEHLAQSDLPVLHLRRALQPAFDQQAEALEQQVQLGAGRDEFSRRDSGKAMVEGSDRRMNATDDTPSKARKTSGGA